MGYVKLWVLLIEGNTDLSFLLRRAIFEEFVDIDVPGRGEAGEDFVGKLPCLECNKISPCSPIDEGRACCRQERR